MGVVVPTGQPREDIWSGPIARCVLDKTDGCATPVSQLRQRIVERALKKAIRHRKNSLFYRSQRGATVGDVYMSLIHTTELDGGNALDYLTELMRHPKAVAENPGAWLPWNYRDALARAAAESAA